LFFFWKENSGTEQRGPDERIVGDLPPALSLSSSIEN
jgi:hypothetical protein